jgi:hypothetical protein
MLELPQATMPIREWRVSSAYMRYAQRAHGRLSDCVQTPRWCDAHAASRPASPGATRVRQLQTQCAPSTWGATRAHRTSNLQVGHVCMISDQEAVCTPRPHCTRLTTLSSRLCLCVVCAPLRAPRWVAGHGHGCTSRAYLCYYRPAERAVYAILDAIRPSVL